MFNSDIDKMAILAGWGRYPVILARHLKSKGVHVHCLAIRGHASPELEQICDDHVLVSPARVQPLLKYLRRHKIRIATMAGKVFKTHLFQRWVWLHNIPDLTFLKYFGRHFFLKAKDNNDDALLLVAIKLFADHGVNFLPATQFLPEILVKSGTLTKRNINQSQLGDLKFAWDLARQMGHLDVGQSVAVKNRAVLAVEAVEGTDECIRRAGQLCPSGGFTVVKVAKPGQDMRFDVPTIGIGTIKTMREAGGRLLVIEADKTIVLDQVEMVKLADEFGISIVATNDEAIEAAVQVAKAA
ncbi:MAG TPA: UDP-2,3-diacylglucosamine diphosphatase LpxI [Pirellulaceae bacterium]|nr:UDP-2,3-diacylglucosamine diphosphatase LpxI [Pirellulaceae bacterium]HMP67836.1 UDP-2,3-diacylglucosamine diphosphatase LpxI [Pirellulaceae bacterium]